MLSARGRWPRPRATMIAPPPAARSRPARRRPRRRGYYDHDEPVRRRSVWPWLLALALVLARRHRRLVPLHADPATARRRTSRSRSSSTSACAEAAAAARRSPPTGSTPHVRHGAERRHGAGGLRLRPGARPRAQGRRRATSVTIWVSTGKPKVDGADRRRQAVDGRGRASSRALGLKPDVHEVALEHAGETRSPRRIRRPGTKVVRAPSCGSTSRRARRRCRCRTSSASRIDQATSRRSQGAGFTGRAQTTSTRASRRTPSSAQDPAAGSSAAKGSTITPDRLEGPDDDAGARRDEPRRRRRATDEHPGRRLQGAHRQRHRTPTEPQDGIVHRARTRGRARRRQPARRVDDHVGQLSRGTTTTTATHDADAVTTPT